MLTEPMLEYSTTTLRATRRHHEEEMRGITASWAFCTDVRSQLAITRTASEPGQLANTLPGSTARGWKCCSGLCPAPTHRRAVPSVSCCNNWSVMTQMKGSHRINSAWEVFFFWSLPSRDELDLTPLCFTADEIIPGLCLLQPETSDLLQSRQIHNQQSK